MTVAEGFRPSGVLRFGVFVHGVNPDVVWRSPEAGSQVAFETYRRVAQTAERGGFAYFFLAEGLRLRENNGEIFELDVAGRPDAQSLLAALAAETSRIGLVATQSATYNDAVDLARRLQSLDLVSGGRAGWNVVTTIDPWIGENFKRGGYLPFRDRYVNAADVLAAARASWRGLPTTITSDYHRVSHAPGLPRSPQGEPVVFQAGVSPQGRDFAARHAEVIFLPYSRLEDAVEFRADIVERTVAAGRDPNAVAIMPAAEFVLAPTAAEAEEKERELRRLQVGPEQAIAFLEAYWGRDLSDLDPEGPLPDFDPVIDRTDGSRGERFQFADAKKVADRLRAEAKSHGWSIRDTAIAKLTARPRAFVGGFDEVADRLAEYADKGAVDGFTVTPYLIPGGIDDVVDELVPRLKERGVYPEAYEGDTLRANLGLGPAPGAGEAE